MKKTNNNWLVFSTIFFAILSVGLAISTAAYAFKLHRLQKLVFGEAQEPNEEKVEDKKSVLKTEYHEMKIVGFQNCGNKIRLKLSANPEPNILKEYITVDPAPKGGLSFSIDQDTEYNPYHLWETMGSSRQVPVVEVSGDFAYRTNLTVKVRKGFPVCQKTVSSNAVVEVLAKDYVHMFRRTDAKSYVSFADKGRYLPPIGKRLIALEAVNATNIEAKISYVPAGNIVQLLALEENSYVKINTWSDEDEFVGDLSSQAHCVNVPLKDVFNVVQRVTLPVLPEDGTPKKGFYLVKIEGVRKEENHGSPRTSASYRLVVVSDLALSVRKTKSKMFTWVTSLSKGLPVEGVDVTIYSSANIPVAKGKTAANGLCECVKIAEGEPFAVVATLPGGEDSSFMALKPSSYVVENFASEECPKYLEKNELAAFAWTERGIYRHGDRVFFHALVRGADFTAPEKLPVEIVLCKPGGEFMKRSVVTDSYGAILIDDIVIPDDQPSGTWTFNVKLPGDNGKVLYSRNIKVEDFAPPQVRVKTVAGKNLKPQDFDFDISAEYLYGAEASNLKCSGAIVFEDVAFAPEGWRGWSFGDCSLSLKPNFRHLSMSVLDGKGRARLEAPLFESSGLPSAAVRAIVQGIVYEDGGRPAYSRDVATLHYYPYYIGTTLGKWVKMPDSKRPRISVACVAPDGKRIAEEKKLLASVTRIDTVYTYQTSESGAGSSESGNTWRCDRVRTVVAENLEIAVSSGKDATFEMPVLESGDYELAISDSENQVSFRAPFYLSDWGDESLSATLSNPSVVTLTADKPFYRPGDRPKICVRSPFPGKALLGVYRDDLLYTEVIELSNATSEIELREITSEHAPNIEVSISVVHGVSAASHHLAARAHGEASLRVRRSENEIDVKVKSSFGKGGVSVDFEAPGAKEAIVTVVDEGINLLTHEKTPDPNAELFKVRTACGRALHDLYTRLLPLAGEDRLLVNGLKTGGDDGADLMSRVSPIGTRRFKPLALWSKKVSIEKGKGSANFVLPEFVGEVRVTVVAYSERAAGSASCRCKIAHKLVVMPDAPRFVAPKDRFAVSLPLANHSGKDGDVGYKIYTSFEEERKLFREGSVNLKTDSRKLLSFDIEAPERIGHLLVVFETEGFGEKHCHELELPVRPAVAWRQTSGVEVLEEGKRFKLPRDCGGAMSRFSYSVSESPASELKDALEWLADYPYGCLEQTVSRMFPLITAGGILNAYSSIEATNRKEYLEGGLRRVMSMMEHDGTFSLWPDVRRDSDSITLRDCELSLYAAHFLLEVEKEDVAKIESNTRRCIINRLNSWAAGDVGNHALAAYACHTLALANEPDKGRMYAIYDARENLSLLSAARLARAFAIVGDRTRANNLLDMIKSPSTVEEAAFALLALLETNPEDSRVGRLVKFIDSKRSNARYSWGTTSENAHAIMALAEYFRRRPAVPGLSNVKEENGETVNHGKGTAFLSWKRLDLPNVEDVKAEESGLKICREFLNADGTPYDISNARRGDYVIAKITLGTDADRTFGDLVIEDLFAGALEPIHNLVNDGSFSWIARDAHDWVFRFEFRDDRAIVFSDNFELKKDEKVSFHYPMRVVSSGTFTLPGVAVEAMYQPELRANSGFGRIVVRD